VGRTLHVPLNKSRILRFARPIAKVSVGNPGIADILVVGEREVYVLGSALGTTNMVLWDKGERIVDTIDLEVTHDLDTLKAKLHELLPGETVAVHSSQGQIVLAGQVSSTPKMDAAVKLATTFAGGGKKGGGVLNLLQVGGSQQVMLQVKVAEVDRTFTRRLGIRFNAFVPGSRWQIGAVSGGARFPNVLGGGADATGAVPFLPLFTESNPVGPPLTAFEPEELGIADKGLFASFLNSDLVFNLVIDAAKNEGLATILAEPTLTTLSGQDARFTAGGEFPVPIASDDNTVTVEFKEFGIGLQFLPLVLDSGVISLKVNVSVSELSAEAAATVQVPGTSSVFAIPSLTKRSAVSSVELASGETIGIAGLINEDVREQINKFPGLGDLPVLGLLFRSQEYVKGQTELVIFVTPRLVAPTRQAEVRLPTDDFVDPTDLEFYLMGRMTGARSERLPTERRGGTEGRFGHDI
jgi:pilus assembly protein CpaC